MTKKPIKFRFLSRYVIRLIVVRAYSAYNQQKYVFFRAFQYEKADINKGVGAVVFALREVKWGVRVLKWAIRGVGLDMMDEKR